LQCAGKQAKLDPSVFSLRKSSFQEEPNENKMLSVLVCRLCFLGFGSFHPMEDMEFSKIVAGSARFLH